MFMQNDEYLRNGIHLFGGVGWGQRDNMYSQSANATNTDQTGQ